MPATNNDSNAMISTSAPRAGRRLSAAIAGTVLAAGSAIAAAAVPASATPTKAAQAGGPTLVVYSAQGYDSAETQAFEKATGIKVSLDDDSTGPLLAKVEAEKNNPKWGLLWVDGATAFASLD
ncbi:MAG TPA: hypothetical protein VFN61_14380, partial [Acidimicrobiales bacterium]|nr:hypothetical protein [Acidimicrobiales bacterium]